MSNPKKLVFFVNVDWFFVSHRLPIALEAIEKGYDVHLITRITDKRSLLEKAGIVVHSISIERGQTCVLSELGVFFSVLRILKSIRPNILHLVTIKPVIYGGLAARILKIHGVVFAISGLGVVFTDLGPVARFRRLLVSLAYKVSIRRKRSMVIFQNNIDLEKLTKIVGLNSDQAVLIPGSGVDLKEFNNLNPPQDSIVVTMAARLLFDKGVEEYIEAAKILIKQGVRARFLLAGQPDQENPNSISEQEYQSWASEGVVQMLGHVTDMPTLLSSTNIFVLPSYYGEGFSKALIEAAAAGRPSVTTSVPGCIDAVISGKTGLVVPPRDEHELANAIKQLVVDKNLREKMGKAARELAEERYSIRHVLDTHLKIYQELL